MERVSIRTKKVFFLVSVFCVAGLVWLGAGMRISAQEASGIAAPIIPAVSKNAEIAVVGDPEKLGEYLPNFEFYFDDKCEREKRAGVCSPACGGAKRKVLGEATVAGAVKSAEPAPVLNLLPVAPAKRLAVEKRNIEVKPTAAAPKNSAVSSRGGGVGVSDTINGDTKIVNGKRVCAKKNDNPSKSKENARGHVDGECCLDPDEIPNARCYYPPEKYGKLLKKYLAR